MKVVEHQPPNAAIISPEEWAIFFGGPIQGAPDWQAEGIDFLENYPSQEEVHILNPRRDYIGEDFVYKRQADWEKAGLRRAAHLKSAKKHGTVIFWFAKRDFNLPYKEGRAYAQTSRFELGRVAGWKDFEPKINLSIGVEPGYKGSEKYITSIAEEFDLPVFPTLEETCVDALKQVLDKI